MTVLFLAFQFPPLGGGGVQRAMKFASYLPEFGIKPVVVTTDRRSLESFLGPPFDDSLLEELPADLAIERIPCDPPGPGHKGQTPLRRYFSLVEPEIHYWSRPLERAWPGLLRTHRPEAIVATMPPFGAGPLACRLAGRRGLPLLLDLRDAWSQWRIGPYRTWLHYWKTLGLERRCLRQARHVVCTSEQTRRDLLDVHPMVPAEKIDVITNGFDADVHDWTIARPAPANGKHHTIGYAGVFYYSPANREATRLPWWRKQPHRMLHYTPRPQDWLYRSPWFFFHSLRRLFELRPDLRARLKVRFAGRRKEWLDRQVAETGLADVVEFQGYLPHREVLAFQRECDSLLVTSAKVEGGRDFSIAGKTFEYFTARKPILGFVTEGAQRDLLERSGMAVLCDPDRTEESARRLGDLVEGRIDLKPDAAFLSGFHRRPLTQRLSELLRRSSRSDAQRSQ